MSNNPALTLPASQSLDCCTPRQTPRHRREEDLSTSGSAGDEELKDGNEKARAKTVGTSKYDVGWRRVVRHFSPA